MLRVILMGILSLATVVVNVLVLGWFFRRLERIEEERWGPYAKVGRNRLLNLLMRGRQRPAGAGTDAAGTP